MWPTLQTPMKRVDCNFIVFIRLRKNNKKMSVTCVRSSITSRVVKVLQSRSMYIRQKIGTRNADKKAHRKETPNESSINYDTQAELGGMRNCSFLVRGDG